MYPTASLASITSANENDFLTHMWISLRPSGDWDDGRSERGMWGCHTLPIFGRRRQIFGLSAKRGEEKEKKRKRGEEERKRKGKGKEGSKKEDGE
ncbi:hypothetical protein HOLleu_06889 [Holothuria leucospilota]|uniref:Uncharacterized protein n=1 Tax=Holothuria leucospilota TaxID=206669 RepID=A0A9Q1HJV4_HOLLE|nr:hypothetical protein HOLleu_06889 [Holothuria leucospilota]